MAGRLDRGRRRASADTTVVPANVKYPTDSGLLASAVAKIGRVVRRIKATGAASRTTFRDRGRAAGRRVRRIASTLRLRGAETRQEAQATVARITGELASLVDQAASEATAVARNARRWLPRVSGPTQGRLVRAINELNTLLDRAARVSAQARLRLGGGKPDSATRLVSLHDPQARPIRKGRIDRPVEFGYKAQVVDNADGVVLDHNVEEGNPADGPQLEPAIRRIHHRTGRVPRAVAADRGYGEARIETQLYDLGVEQVAIPRKGATAAHRRRHEQRPAFRRLVKWRTGCEGRISHLKHRYGWHRTHLGRVLPIS